MDPTTNGHSSGHSSVAPSAPRPLRVGHVITDLQTGGAEMMLLRLLERSDGQRFEHRVLSLKQTHPIGDRIAELGVPVEALGIGAVPSPTVWPRLVGWLRQVDVVQTWMVHADFFGGLGALLAGRVPVAWGVHVGKLDRATHGLATVTVARANALLSRLLPRVVVSCSETSRRELLAMGYRDPSIQVIPNGFDLDRFHPDEAARAAVRAELKLPATARVVGLLTRDHPQKDLPTLFAAGQPLLARVPDAHLVLAGRGVEENNATLTAPLAGWPSELRSRLHLLGPRSDTPRLLCAFDVLCSSSSYGEAFPLVLGEAMSAGVPCVATDCGDSALLIGDTGRVVPIRDPAALSQALFEVITLPDDERRRLGVAARARIAERFQLGDLVGRYERLWQSIARR